MLLPGILALVLGSASPKREEAAKRGLEKIYQKLRSESLKGHGKGFLGSTTCKCRKGKGKEAQVVYHNVNMISATSFALNVGIPFGTVVCKAAGIVAARQ